jgi:hypothetical protein
MRACYANTARSPLEHPHPGAAGRVYGAREWEILARFGVGPTMAARPTRGARSVVLASAPVLFDPAALGALDLAWLGGFFDGEGSITHASRLHRGHAKTYTMPLVRMNNTHMPVLPCVRAIMDAHGLAYDCSPHCVSPQERKLPFWTLGTQGVTRNSAWLTVLLPYLHTKRGQAEEMLEYCRQHLARPRVRVADATRIGAAPLLVYRCRGRRDHGAHSVGRQHAAVGAWGPDLPAGVGAPREAARRIAASLR